MLKSEFVKTWSLRTNLILLAVLILINLICAISVEKQNYASWKENAKKQYKEYDEALAECIKEGVNEEYCRPFVEKTILLQYSLEKNIPYGVTSVFSHMLRLTEVLSLFIVIAVYLGSKIYSNEYDENTWKNLFCTGAKKRKIYLTKFIFTICYMLIYMTVFLLLSVVIGFLYFGGGSSGTVLSYVNGQVIENNILAEIFTVYGMTLIKLLFYVLFVHACMIFTGQKMISFLSAVIIMMVVPWINMLLGSSSAAKALPFYYLNMGFDGYSMELLLYVLVLAGYSIVLTVVSYVKFTKKEWKYC